MGGTTHTSGKERGLSACECVIGKRGITLTEASLEEASHCHLLLNPLDLLAYFAECRDGGVSSDF